MFGGLAERQMKLTRVLQQEMFESQNQLSGKLKDFLSIALKIGLKMEQNFQELRHVLSWSVNNMKVT